MVGASRGAEEGENASIFPAPEEPCFALFGEGEKKSSSILFVEGGRGSTSAWGCPGTSVLGQQWREQSWRAAGSLPPSIAPVEVHEIPRVGMHHTGMDVPACCIQPG